MWTWIIVGIVIGLAVLLCFLLAIANFSFENFEAKLKEYSVKRNSYGITTHQYVDMLNKNYFNGRLKIAKCARLKDHYSRGIVALSEETMNSNSLASLAIISHEMGHARQDASGDSLEKHWRMRRTGRICGFFFMPLLIVGAVLCLLWVFEVLSSIYFLVAGVTCLALALFIFIFAIILKYKEIKIEKEASEFAIEYLKEILLDDEIQACRDLLNSAKLTYWAGLIRTLLSWTMLTGKDTMFK